jgi:hypothetical protein
MRSEESNDQSRARRPLAKITALLFILFLMASFNLSGYAVSGQTIGDHALLTGVIASPDGPIGGIAITLNIDLEESFIPIANVTTDEDGSYKFLDVPMGHPYLIEFNHGGVSHLRKFDVMSITRTLNFNLSGTINFSINGIEGSPMEDVEVDLVSKDAFRVGSTQTDSSGSGNFTHLDIDVSYLITFDEAGVPYTEIAEFDNKALATVEFDVLETTTSDEDVAVNVHHVFLEKEEGYLSVWEGITFKNAGDKIFNNSWLRISIPSVAEDISVDIMDCCLQNAEQGVIVDPMDPIFPDGKFDITLTYKIKLKSKDLIFDKNVDYDTGSLSVFVEDGISDVVNLRGLSFDEKRAFSDISYLIYNGALIASGSIASITLRGIVTVKDLILGNQLVWAGGLLLVPIAFIALFVTYNKRSSLKKVTKSRGRRPPRENGVNDTRFRQMKPKIDEPFAQDSIKDLRAEEEALNIIQKKIKIDHEKGTLSDDSFKMLRSKYRRRQKKVRSAISNFKVIDEGEEDLLAEKRILESVIVKITKDLNNGTITESAHRKLVAKYVEQLGQIEDKLSSYEENGA